MIRRFFLIALSIIVCVPAYSQILVKGKVLSLYNEQALSFANIGIINTGVGSIANADGNFSIKIPGSHAKDSVIFSQLGFDKLMVAVSDLSNENASYTIYLKESLTNLKAVTIVGDSWKRRKYKLGNPKYEGSGIYADTVTAGSAMALLIKNELNFPVYVRQANLMIVNNTFGEFKVRVRFYDVDSIKGLPGKDILNESVITWSSLENGKLKVDLAKYNVEVHGDFYLSFEWILDKRDRAHLFEQYHGFLKEHPDLVSVDYSYIDGIRVPYYNYQGNLNVGPTFGISVARKTLEDHVCYYRLNSFGRWFRSSSVLSAEVILSNTPSMENSRDKATDVMKDYPSSESSSYIKITLP